ncbi:MAG TPA: acylneuraminate cytidylyltransferase family protein [Tepidisphaeraceae bacterium]|jgi:CMP-N-acetylneuraminic acid synthetase
MKPRIAAIVPMRHDSKRVPGKNWRNLGGKPLFCHVIDALQNSGVVDQIVIDTDSDTIRSIVSSEMPHVALLTRPAHLRDDCLPMNDVLMHTTSRVRADFYIQTHSTNPLLTAATIATAARRFIDRSGIYDSLFGVTKLQQRLWDSLARPVNHDPAVLQRTQDLSPLFVENSCIYVFSRDTLTHHGSRIGARPMMFEIDRVEAWDIDEEDDFVIAEMLFQKMQQQQRSAA